MDALQYKPSDRLRKVRGVMLAVILAAIPYVAQAHCDTMDGPVVVEARIALEQGEITPVLKWIKANQEAELRSVFEQALTVRGQSPEARELADRYFFETLVRLHRAAEGAPYEGIKPAGQQEPIVMLADQALAQESSGKLTDLLTKAVQDGIHERFEHALHAYHRADNSVESGREFVAAYVEYMHYAERLLQNATTDAAHSADSTPATHDAHEH